MVQASQMEPIKCPVCAKHCLDPPLYRYTASEAAAHFCPITRDADRHQRLCRNIGKLWRGAECIILKCNDCGFAFGYPFVGGDEEFYRILHEQQGYPVWRWDYDIAIQLAIKPVGGGRILDIGAGVGKFLRSLDKSWNKYAVEGSEFTRTQLEACGIRVFRELPTSAYSKAATFQVITMFQVLEHIAEFRLLLSQCRQLLTTAGRLVITVPDGEAMIRQERITGCPDMPPNHINKWTPESLSRILHETGFETQHIVFKPETWRNVYSAMHLRVGADSASPRSLAAQVYRIRSKRMRMPFFALLGVSALFRMLPNIGHLRKGGAFALVANIKDH